jgi:hypothetical protein
MSVLDLVRIREREGMRLSRIAENARVDYGRLWRASRGGNHLHPSELERLAQVLDPIGRHLPTAS